MLTRFMPECLVKSSVVSSTTASCAVGALALALSACGVSHNTKTKESLMVPAFGSGEIAIEDAGAGGVAASGDLNGDGRLDAVALDVGSSELTILLADTVGGTPRLVAGQRFKTGNRPRRVLSEDLNGDDILDLAVPNLFSDDLYVNLGKGDGSFDASIVIAVEGSGPTDVAAGDFNGDGHKDLVTSNAFSSDVSLLFGDGSGSFETPVRIPTGHMPMAIESADMDGDGNPDFATASSASRLTVFFADGAGGFEPNYDLTPEPPITFPFAMDTWVAADLALTDLNDDGLVDVALVQANRDVVTVVMGDEARSYTKIRRAFKVGHGPREIKLDDFNGDGVTDLAVLNGLSNEVSILLGMASRELQDPGPLGNFGFPRFTRPVNYLTPPAPRRLVLGRFQDRAVPDMIVAASRGSAGGVGSASFAMGSLGSIPPPVIESVAPVSGPKAGGTGIELQGLNFQAGARVFVDGIEATGVTVLPQNRIMAFTPASARGSGGTVEVRVINPDGRSATRPGAFTYIVNVTEPLSFTRLVFCNDGAEPAGFPSLPDCDVRIFKDAEAADLNGNGLIDIYAASADSATARDQVYLNTGTRSFHLVTRGDGSTGFLAAGLFEPHDVASAAVQPRYDVQAADIAILGSGEFTDQRRDIVSVDGFQLRLLVNTGNDGNGVPIFDDQAQTRIYDNTSDVDMAYNEMPNNSFVWDDIDIGDIDLDGDLDIALGNRNRKTTFNQGGDRGNFLLINDDGRGNFLTFELPLSNMRADHDVELADIDNDCDLDLIFSGHSGTPASAPTILVNTIRSSCTDAPGTLAFTEESSRLNSTAALGADFNYVGAEAPSGPLDINGDGFVDLHLGGNREALLINRGAADPGVFDEAVSRTTPAGVEPLIPVGGFGYGGHYGDLDLDGKTDIVAGDYGGRPIVLLNRVPPGATKDQIEAMAAPFEEIPARVGMNGRGDPGDFWPSMNPMPEPDEGEDLGRMNFVPVPPLDPGGIGKMTVPHGPQMGVELRDFDKDNDLDILFSYGDGGPREGQPRINRIFLNDHRAEDAGIGPTRGLNGEGREILHWRDEVTFACFNNGSITEVTMRLFPEESGGAPPIVMTKTQAQAQADNIDQNGDGLFDFVFTVAELFPRHGNTVVSFEYTVELAGGGTIQLEKNQNIFIDPSGIVFDEETHRPIVGAEVVLEVLDGGGNWVLPQLANIRPQINPQSTGTDGGYGWDVVPGRYRVRVSADDYLAKISREVDIPPEVTDLDVGLTPVEMPHFTKEETVSFGWFAFWKWFEVDLGNDLRQKLEELAGTEKIRFAEAAPGSTFKGPFLNWPFDELGLELNPETGSVMGDVKARDIFKQADPRFLGLIDVLDDRGRQVAEIWLDLKFEKD